jgi:hypothetical protein
MRAGLLRRTQGQTHSPNLRSVSRRGLAPGGGGPSILGSGSVGIGGGMRNRGTRPAPNRGRWRASSAQHAPAIRPTSAIATCPSRRRFEITAFLLTAPIRRALSAALKPAW